MVGDDAVDERTGCRAIAELEATGIPWAAVQRWLDEVHPGEAFTSRMFLKQVLLVLSDDQASPRERSRSTRAVPAADRGRHCRLSTIGRSGPLSTLFQKPLVSRVENA